MQRNEALKLLRAATGNEMSDFRNGQWEAIDFIVNQRKKLLVVQRTGWGKSIVYFISARIRRDRGYGPTIIISPLLALMKNQIAAAKKINTGAVTINSSNQDDWEAVKKQVLEDHVDVMLISPERLANDEFIENVLLPVAQKIGLLVIDEAHCISDWGHDFRPDYRRIVNVLRNIPPNTPLLCTTATANERVIRDIEEQLGDIQTIRGPLIRESLALQNIRLADQAERLAWLAYYVPKIKGTGIIYVLTKRDADYVTRWLQKNGIDAEAYYSDVMNSQFPDSNDYRRYLEDRLLANDVKAVVATSALGMGYDKPDLGFVIHFQAPGSVIAYYQQVGRAGRAIEHARGILLSGTSELLFSAPVPLDSSRIAFISAERGIRALRMYDADTGDVFTFSAGAALDRKIWPYIRGLSAGGGELLFSYHDGEGLYKLARIELGREGQPELILSDTNYSGGVFSPVRAGNRIIYRAQFSGTDALAVYPENDSADTVKRYPLSLVPQSGEAASTLVTAQGAAPELPVSLSAFPSRFDEKKYSPLSWLNPLDLWFPVPLVRSAGLNLRLDGGGFVTYMGTPTDMNVFLLFAAYDARERMGELDATWVSFTPGSPLTVRFTDNIKFFTNDSFRYPYRETRGSASLAFTRGIGGERVRFSVDPSFEAMWIALPHPDAASAYSWPYEDSRYIPGLSLSLMNRDRLPWELFGRGLSITVSGKAALPDPEFRWDAVFRASAGKTFPVRMTLYGARDESGIDIDGSSVMFDSGPWASAAATEYAANDDGGHRWVAGGEAEFCFFTADIQKPLSHVYGNRLFGILAWRGVMYDSRGTDAGSTPSGIAVAPDIDFVNSLVLKAGAVVTLLPVPMLPVRLSPHGWVAWKLADGAPLDPDESVAFGLSFQIEW